MSDVLVLPPGLTDSARSIAATAARRGLDVVPLASSAVPEAVAARAGQVHLHAGPSFVDVVAGPLGVAPLEAPIDWLAGLPAEVLRRRVVAVPVAEAWALRGPAFVKSPNDKSIAARVYADGSHLPGSDAVDPDTVVLVSQVVTYVEEVRLHVLDDVVRAASRYATDGRLDPGPASAEAQAFATDLLAAVAPTLPSAIVVDVGLDSEGGWSVIEANAAWGSGRYVSDLDAVLDVVLRSAGPVGRLRERDRAFVRLGG